MGERVGAVKLAHVDAEAIGRRGAAAPAGPSRRAFSPCGGGPGSPLFSRAPLLDRVAPVAENMMTQTNSRFFDEIARLMNDAAGVAQGVRREVDTVFRAQAERVLRDLDVVPREEFEAVKEMARLAREENEALAARVAALEARLAASQGG